MAAATPVVRSKMLMYATSITRNPGVSELLVDDAIVRCAETIDLTKVPKSRIKSYLMTTVRNMCFSWHRHGQVVQAHVETLRETSAKSSLAESISAEVLGYFKKLVARLPRAYRRVVLLRVLDELSYSEISKRLKIPKGTVMSRLFRVRQKLWRLVDYLKAD